MLLQLASSESKLSKPEAIPLFVHIFPHINWSLKWMWNEENKVWLCRSQRRNQGAFPRQTRPTCTRWWYRKAAARLSGARGKSRWGTAAAGLLVNRTLELQMKRLRQKSLRTLTALLRLGKLPSFLSFSQTQQSIRCIHLYLNREELGRKDLTITGSCVTDRCKQETPRKKKMRSHLIFA